MRGLACAIRELPVSLLTMITSLSQLDPNGRYTYADYLTWQLDEYVELIQGKIYAMSPAPLRWHQDVTGNIYRLIGNYLEISPCKVYIAPFDVRFVKKHTLSDTDVTTVVQPDICVVCDKSKLDRRGCIGAPDLIVEILSPSTAKKDLDEKFHLYEEFGVREYWVVFPKENTVHTYAHNGTALEKVGVYEETGRIPIGILPGFEIDMEAIFKE